VTTPVSPNTVLANALTATSDVLAPRILDTIPDRVVFAVGTQINGAPHLGTSLVQAFAFAWAAHTQARFDIPTDVHFGALDNAPYEVTTDPRTGIAYQRAYAQALGEPAVTELIDVLYRPLFEALSDRLGIPFTVETYSRQQARRDYRETWLRLQPRLGLARFDLAPSSGTPHVRVPCPRCGWADKYAVNTAVTLDKRTSATVRATCLTHGTYETVIRPDGGGYLDLATLYRNLVKEITPAAPRTLQVMVKGGDWIFGSALVDAAALATGIAHTRLPARVFCPQIVTDTGAKLSKSLIRDGLVALPPGAEPWMLDAREWPGTVAEYADALLGLAHMLLSDPRHFFRSYSAAEIGRMMAAPSTRNVPAP
jgi:hypothetical protein